MSVRFFNELSVGSWEQSLPNQPKTVAVAIKTQKDGRYGVLVPNAYRGGWPGSPLDKSLNLDKYLLEVTISHDDDKQGRSSTTL